MSNFMEFLKALNEDRLLAEGKSYTKEQLDPVVIKKPCPPGGSCPMPPPPVGGGKVTVEVHNVGDPPPPRPPKDGDEEDEKDGKTKVKVKGEKPKTGKKPGDGEGKGESEAKPGDKEGKGEGEGKPGDKEGKGERKTPGKDGVEIQKQPAGSGEPKGKQSGPGKRRTSFDAHEITKKSNVSGAKELSEKIFKEAAEKRAKKNQGGRSESGKGGFLEKLGGAYESKVDWKAELEGRINTFQSQTARAMARWMKTSGKKYREGAGQIKSKSYAQWLRNPRSHATLGSKDQMIFKGPYVKSPISEVVLIVALDTSGSVGADTFETVFGEMDNIAAKFERGMSASGQKLEGKVYFMTWDTDVQQVERYKSGDWKKYVTGEREIAGRGGTNIGPTYDYLNKHFKYDENEEPSMGVFNIMKGPTDTAMDDDDVVLPVNPFNGTPEASPFLIVATDGHFGNVNDSTLGNLYKDNKDNIVYLIIKGTDEFCYPDNVIKYDEVKI